MSENPQEPQAPQQPGVPHQQAQPGPDHGSPQPAQSPYQGQPQQPGPGAVPGQAYGAPYQQQPLTPSDERMWSVFAQVGPFLLAFIAPLVIWLVLKDRSRFVDQEAKESLNFQITLVIASVAIGIISLVTFGLGTILYLAFIAAIIFMILAAVENGKGAPYRYPVNIRFIK
jgi:uncharacterized Tic20 family protein